MFLEDQKYYKKHWIERCWKLDLNVASLQGTTKDAFFWAFFPQEVIYRIETSTNKVIRSILEKYDEHFYYFRFVYETDFIGTLYLRATWSLNLNDVQFIWSHESVHYTFHAAIEKTDLISFSSLLSLVTNSGIF